MIYGIVGIIFGVVIAVTAGIEGAWVAFGFGAALVAAGVAGVIVEKRKADHAKAVDAGYEARIAALEKDLALANLTVEAKAKKNAELQTQLDTALTTIASWKQASAAKEAKEAVKKSTAKKDTKTVEEKPAAKKTEAKPAAKKTTKKVEAKTEEAKPKKTTKKKVEE